MIRMLQERDMEQINGWLKHYDHPELIYSNLPQNKYIIDDMGAAALMLTDTNVAYIDLLVLNEKVDKEDRETVLLQLVGICESRAKELGYTVLCGITFIPSILEKSLRHGFSLHLKTNVLIKEIK